MQGVPSLLSLCVKTIAATILHGYDHLELEEIFELPPELFDSIVMNLSPLALQYLHERSMNGCHRRGFATKSDGRKRGRCADFNMAWKELLKKRWPEHVKKIQPINQMTEQNSAEICKLVICDDWQQTYWEKHLQNCLDGAAERALLPSFDGHIGELTVPDDIVESIGHRGFPIKDCSKLLYHCNKFGRYARCLTLQNVLCVPETCEFLGAGKLQSLVFRRIFSKSHVTGVCLLLNQNRETLVSLEFIHCRLSPSALDQICHSIYEEAAKAHELQCLSVKSCSIFESSLPPVPSGFLSFLSSGRSLKSLNFCDTRMGPAIAKIIFDTLLESSCELVTLEISDNNIAGWLSKVHRSSTDSSLLRSATFMKSLSVLNLRGNNLCKGDVEDLNLVLVHMPNLRSLDISDNPIKDDGLRILIPYLIKAFEKVHPLSYIKMDNCSLSGMGVSELLGSLPSLKEPLNILSLADNDLGSSVASPLAKFLGIANVKVLNVEDIGLGPMGFQELEEQVPPELTLVCINISKNRGGDKAAYFISKVISQAPDLVAVNAGYNFMTPESSRVIHDAVEQSKGKLEQLDLTGNFRLHESIYTPKLLRFHYHGKPIVVIPPQPSSHITHDDDP